MKKVYDPLERAKQNPKSLRAAIDAMCWDCQGRDADPAPRWRIGDCTSPDCPLYPVRPYQGNQSRPMPDSLRCLGPQAKLADDSESRVAQ